MKLSAKLLVTVLGLAVLVLVAFGASADQAIESAQTQAAQPTGTTQQSAANPVAPDCVPAKQSNADRSRQPKVQNRFVFNSCEDCNAVCPGPCFMHSSGLCHCMLDHTRLDPNNPYAEKACKEQGLIVRTDKAGQRICTKPETDDSPVPKERG